MTAPSTPITDMHDLKIADDVTEPKPHASPRNKDGWDGKLRVDKTPEKKAMLANPEALSDPEYSDDEAPPVEEIAADEELLDDCPDDEDDIDVNHRRISSIPSLRLERFTKLERLCLRQNHITSIELPESLGSTLKELDLYDNLIAHIKGLEHLTALTTLDLSYNKIKHIKRLETLLNLTHLYLIQNKISTIENLSHFSNLKMLELGGNRIRTIQGLDKLPQLEELWLGKNKITSISGLDALTNLKTLSIQSNRLTSLSGLSHLTSLETLLISHNNIPSIPENSLPPSLLMLDISNNPISRLENLGHLTELMELWASNCQLGDFNEVERELKEKKDLECVYFEGNPLQLKQPVLYRKKVHLALPEIKQIDATFVRVS